MRTEFILLVIIGGFFSALLVFLIIIYRPAFPAVLNQSLNKKITESAVSNPNSINELKSRIQWLEEQQQQQIKALQDLKTYVSTRSAQTQSGNKSILTLANTQGSLFTTTSSTYTPMGMYVNTKCISACLLWINFYSSSKNLGSSSSAQGNINTYDIFLDEADQSIYTQANYPVASTSIPVSLNATISVAAGIHTIEIRSKTTGGTLESDSSALQVMAIEK